MTLEEAQAELTVLNMWIKRHTRGWVFPSVGLHLYAGGPACITVMSCGGRALDERFQADSVDQAIDAAYQWLQQLDDGVA